jgi:hypothetical protein
MKRLIIVMFLAGCLTMSSIPSGAMHFYLTFDDIIKKADVIFLGQVTGQRSRYGDGKKMIFTDVYFEVARLIHCKEELEPITHSNIMLTFAGGNMEGESFAVSDVPSFETGATYLLFTVMDGKIYPSPVVGGVQGLFRVLVDQEQGIQYPLTFGRHGISAIRNGRIVTTLPVHKVQGRSIEGLLTDRDPRFHDVAPKLVEEVAETDRTRLKASVAPVKKDVPVRLMTLDELIDAVYERIKEGGAGR